MESISRHSDPKMLERNLESLSREYSTPGHPSNETFRLVEVVNNSRTEYFNLHYDFFRIKVRLNRLEPHLNLYFDVLRFCSDLKKINTTFKCIPYVTQLNKPKKSLRKMSILRVADNYFLMVNQNKADNIPLNTSELKTTAAFLNSQFLARCRKTVEESEGVWPDHSITDPKAYLTQSQKRFCVKVKKEILRFYHLDHDGNLTSIKCPSKYFTETLRDLQNRLSVFHYVQEQRSKKASIIFLQERELNKIDTPDQLYVTLDQFRNRLSFSIYVYNPINKSPLRHAYSSNSLNENILEQARKLSLYLNSRQNELNYCLTFGNPIHGFNEELVSDFIKEWNPRDPYHGKNVPDYGGKMYPIGIIGVSRKIEAIADAFEKSLSVVSFFKFLRKCKVLDSKTDEEIACIKTKKIMTLNEAKHCSDKGIAAQKIYKDYATAVLLNGQIPFTFPLNTPFQKEVHDLIQKKWMELERFMAEQKQIKEAAIGTTSYEKTKAKYVYVQAILQRKEEALESIIAHYANPLKTFTEALIAETQAKKNACYENYWRRAGFKNEEGKPTRKAILAAAIAIGLVERG